MRQISKWIVGLTALVLAAPVFSSTVTITIDNPNGFDPSNKTYTVECGVVCEGFYQANTGLQLSSEAATAWGGVNPGKGGAFEAAFLDGMLTQLGLDPVGANFAKIEGGGSMFETDREYFWVKQGEWIAYFRNTGDGFLTVDLGNQEFSHYGVAGAVIPIPPAFVLFGSALVGVGWLARRQRCCKHDAREAVTV
jgi:hypothetical protein